MVDTPGEIDADIVVLPREHHTLVLLRGTLDRMAAAPVRRRLQEIADARPGPLVVDLAELAFLDTAGMRALSAVARHCAEHVPGPGGLALVGARPFTARMFRLLRLHESVPLCADVREALWCLIPPTDEEIADWLGPG
ncbi:STAS domain-containing protein [Spirillospora sp. NPDC127200]